MEDHIWKQSGKESDKAYRAAKCYFDLGRERTLKEAARRLGMKIDQVQYLHDKYDWEKRSRALDRSSITDEDVKQAARQAEINERVHNLRLKMLEKAEQMLKFPLTRQRAVRNEDGEDQMVVVEPMNWKPDDAIKLTKASMELGKLVLDVGSFDESLLAETTGTIPAVDKPKPTPKKKRRKKKVLKKR